MTEAEKESQADWRNHPHTQTLARQYQDREVQLRRNLFHACETSTDPRVSCAHAAWKEVAGIAMYCGGEVPDVRK